MRLQGVYGGAVYATEHRRVLTESDELRFRSIGRLPLAAWRVSSPAEWITARRRRQSFVERIVGSFPTVNVWRLTETNYLATSGRWVFRTTDGGRTWTKRRLLPPTSGQMGVLPSGVCFYDGAVYLGEYPLDDSETPRIRRSTDYGRTWETLVELPSVRHVHALQVDPYSGALWITTGDKDEESFIGRVRNGELEIVGGGSQQWRAVDLAFTPSAVLWGVDCPYLDSKPILRLERSAIGPTAPPVETVHTATDPFFYGTCFEVNGESWAVFSTAVTPQPDSTGPDEARRETGTVKVLGASSASSFTDWFLIREYRKRPRPVDRLNPADLFPNSNAYVFLASDSDRGLFLNPYNTKTADGEILQIPVSQFENLERDPREALNTKSFERSPDPDTLP